MYKHQHQAYLKLSVLTFIYFVLKLILVAKETHTKKSDFFVVGPLRGEGTNSLNHKAKTTFFFIKGKIRRKKYEPLRSYWFDH